MQRMYLKKRKKIKNKTIIIIILILISLIYLFRLFNKIAIPKFISYGEIETKKIITLLINNKVLKEISSNVNVDDIFIITRNDDGQISSIDFNTNSINLILMTTSTLIEENINNLSKGTIYEVPSGIIFNNVFISNLLPKIPVKLELISSAFCKIDTDVNSYGINNALIKVNVDITLNIRIIMPFTSKITDVNMSIPIAIKLIEGSIPGYYFNGYLNNPSIN